MTDTPTLLSPPGDSQRIKAEITRFLREERLQPKLDKLKDGDDEARQKLIAEHQPSVWIADAAQRVGQIQQVSHAVKFTHPSAGGSSLSSAGNPAADPLVLGTHALGAEYSADVVGNAAALDVYKFLRLIVGNETLLHLAIRRDEGFLQALSDKPAEAQTWCDAFASLPEAKGSPVSHTLAKQVYWPVGQGTYHLLAPLLSSSLAHAAYQRINGDRFSDEAKAAREARRAGKAHPHGYRDYPGLAIQSFGGSKPQNISQLNSERRGENYLLASLPPEWISAAVKPPLKTETVFATRGYFGGRKEVKRITSELRRFLRKHVDDQSNQEIRQTRADYVDALIDQVVQMAAELGELAPGWSASPECQLSSAEQCWLDPDRALDDEAFAAVYRLGNWQDEVCLRFANWLNAGLETDKTLFGEVEAREWKLALQEALGGLKGDLGHD